jgi:hypothetical protein
MTEVAYDFEAPKDVLEAILAKAKKDGIEASAPVPCQVGTSPIHSPLSGAELKEALEMAILIFNTGAAAAAFFASLGDLLDKFGDRGAARTTNRSTKKSDTISGKHAKK